MKYILIIAIILCGKLTNAQSGSDSIRASIADSARTAYLMKEAKLSKQKASAATMILKNSSEQIQKLIHNTGMDIETRRAALKNVVNQRDSSMNSLLTTEEMKSFKLAMSKHPVN